MRARKIKKGTRRSIAAAAAGVRRWARQAYRDLRVLVRLFPWRVGLSLVASVALAALLFQRAYNSTAGVAGALRLSYIKAVYAILNMAAFQVTFADMPPGPYLDIFFVIVPLVSLPLLLIFGANLFHVIRVFFVRRERGQLWQRAFASTVDRPIVICGLGHVGYRVAQQLLDLERPIIGIEAKESALTQLLIDRNVPVILGDVREKEVLRGAGVDRATAIIVCTHSDMANIEAVFHVRELNPKARVVMRLFQDELADEMVQHFHTQHVLSRSAIAAQGFAYAALGLEVLETFQVRGERYALVEIPIAEGWPLHNTRLSDVADMPLSTIVCLHREGQLLTEPRLDTTLQTGDTLFVFTHANQIARLLDCSAGSADTRPILVCGLGHTGYRVVKVLRELGRTVRAVAVAPSPLSEQVAAAGVPVAYGDFRTLSVLRREGVDRADALIACTEDDMVNFETAIRAKQAHPDLGLRTVIRVFEDALGDKLQEAFGIDAVISSSAMAAPAFVAAALNIRLAHSVLVGGRALVLARITIEAGAALFGAPIGALAQDSDLIILLHQRGDQIEIPPDPASDLHAGDELVILATQEKLRALSLRNAGDRATP